ncbi:hypothetical protein BDW22DRAFT_1355743 [Trametopsis cervina]|nr:hypothetical protein BDW22DRAFT_1355743 [Trametopsis cervina]
MGYKIPLLFSLASVAATLAAPSAPQWRFDVKQTPSGIVALESIVVSQNLVIFFDLASDDPLQINGHSAWGALWDLQTSTVKALDVVSNSFCASGSLLSNGTMASIGGDQRGFDGNPSIVNGTNAIRIFEPCASPSGEGCTLFDNPSTLHLAAPRWYATAIRIYDGSLLVIGGIHQATVFYNTDPENSYEFYPPRGDGSVIHSPLLERTLPANLFPRAFALPDGKAFIISSNQTIIYDFDKNIETRLPDLPNGVHTTNPIDGSAILLPLHPPLYTPEVLVCGGHQIVPGAPLEELSSQMPATSQCSRITLTPEGIKKGWEVEHMFENRIMPELLHLPNGKLLLINGGQTGFAAFAGVPDAIGNSNADHPNYTPSIYTPDAPNGQRFSKEGMPTSKIARMYHSTVTLTPQGNFLIAGSNPNGNTTEGPDVVYPSEFRVETLDPPYMFVDRPKWGAVPDKIAFGKTITVPVTIPSNLKGHTIQVSLIDLGFSSHVFHSGARLVFLDFTLSKDRKHLTFTLPPNGKIYPPGPATLFLTVDDVSSEGVRFIVGSGRPPPTLY